ncbi:hypothetical protein HYE54_12380 [Aggregatibacter actinomycetemcomitans]|uniref:hypothetical protein n=1 Tax=Aggregatibacter actinomycetemcomitans TaxID=714 RepID=UPI00197BA345|nr:hypothetical protein [Aggregatibacter actinomycetemcomitans]MBN6067449.1 hypothetical protein [Aggregatibacter actinomycetemcomitans]MBN6068853.1 hypothetical protein [Aggregatibacter actinomycetemcomitans]MBN6069432.1 hypothetical protein [Aggregatibacter actinomycetemcomitans]MBN6069488.1 hypothetical protein [Aggregatibacter actinomycetemcomitans]MBN6086943.1 hypothetical protein [Aggregatibacter actinomycetemcomitans]
MSNLFDLVSDFSGQKNSVTIPRIYIKLCGGDFTTAAVLSQLVFWSSKGKRSDGYFWKSYEDIANELCEDEITAEQVRYSVKKLKSLLPDCFFVEVKRANGITTNHYRFEQLIFLEKLQNLKNGKFPDTVNWKIPNRENSHSGMGKFPDTVNGKIPVPVTDPNQILTTYTKKNIQKKSALLDFKPHFEKFWAAGMRKIGKPQALKSFKSAYESYNAEYPTSLDDFTQMLVDDVIKRNGLVQFGFDKLHPATYLNNWRWLDEYPQSNNKTTEKPSAHNNFSERDYGEQVIPSWVLDGVA